MLVYLCESELVWSINTSRRVVVVCFDVARFDFEVRKSTRHFQTGCKHLERNR